MAQKISENLEIVKFLDKAPKNTEDTEEEKVWKEFLAPAKVIRDAVHGDIRLTDMEIKIINHPIFQRLRGIKQLSPVHLIYPSANHTRFEHCLGALYIAQKIIESVERNFDYQGNFIYALHIYHTVGIRVGP